MKAMNRFVGFVLSVAFAAGCLPEKEVILVERGEPRAYVALDAGASASVTNAATALVHWVKEKTGAELAIYAGKRKFTAEKMAIDSGKRRLVASVGNANGSAKENLSDNTGDSLRSDETSLPREEAPLPDDQTPIVFRKLSASDLTAGFSNDGFRVDATARRVTICAKEDIGFEFAVYYLLSHYAGIDWFHPESGADFEKTDTLAVPVGTLAKTPPAWRDGTVAGHLWDGKKNLYNEGRKIAQVWNRRNGFYDEKYRMGGHIIGEWLLWTPVDETELKRETDNIHTNWTGVFRGKPRRDVAELYARWKILVRQHPDWFALSADGKRVPCGQELMACIGWTAMPCLSNPEVREQMLKNFIARRHWQWFDTWPVANFDIICDDHPCWCMCPNCMKLIKETGKASPEDKAADYYWDFVNWIAPRMLAADPTLTINAYAYQSHRAFPQRVKPIPLGERLNVVVCTHGRCYMHPLTNAACKANAPIREMIETWRAAGFPVITMDYQNQTPGRCNYFFWERAWVEDLRWYRANGVLPGYGLTGAWFGWTNNDHYYYDMNGAKARWPMLWLTGRFEWDPDEDFDTVRDAMTMKYYGAAGREMTAYRRYLETKLYDAGIHMGYVDTSVGSHDHFAQCVAGRPGVLKPAQDLLAAAKKAAADDPKALGRIAWDEKYFHEEWELAAPLVTSTEYFSRIKNHSFDKASGDYSLLGHMKAYPEVITRFRVTFKAKGKGTVKALFRRLNAKKNGYDYVEANTFDVASPDDFTDRAFDVDCGTDTLGPFLVHVHGKVEFKDWSIRAATVRD